MRGQRYGAGLGGLLGQVAPNALPTALQLARQAIGDADSWWGRQGSTPKPLDLQVAPTPDGEHLGWGDYNSGRVTIAPTYLQSLDGVLMGSGSRRGKAQALVGLWRLVAHERGHNLGYQHIPGGIMDADWAAPPGESYRWARQVLGPRRPPRR